MANVPSHLPNDPYLEWEKQAIALLEEGDWESEFIGERYLRMIDDRRRYNAEPRGVTHG